jgi:hypothetical protein
MTQYEHRGRRNNKISNGKLWAPEEFPLVGWRKIWTKTLVHTCVLAAVGVMGSYLKCNVVTYTVVYLSAAISWNHLLETMFSFPKFIYTFLERVVGSC